MTAREAAEAITSTYDTISQFAAVATSGCGEWELDRAAELAEASDATPADICAEVERICRAKVEAK